VALATSSERDEQGVSFLSLGRRWSLVVLILVTKMLLVIAETDSLISLTFQPILLVFMSRIKSSTLVSRNEEKVCATMSMSR
jgi:hypothetical protein